MTVDKKSKDKARNLRNEFKNLPIEGKIATLIELETITMAEALDTIAECSISFGKKIFDTVLPNTGKQSEHREPRRPSPENKGV